MLLHLHQDTKWLVVVAGISVYTAKNTFPQVAMVTSWLPSTVTAAFGGSRSSIHVARSNIIGAEISFLGNNHRRRRSQTSHPHGYASEYLRAKDDYTDDSTDMNIDEGDLLSSDRREGMAGAFAALESLTGDDFDDLAPLPFVSSVDNSNSNIITMDSNTLMEMQSELSALGEDGLYDNIFEDLTSEELMLEDDESMMSLVVELDKTIHLPVVDAIATSDTMVLNDADGIGSVQSTVENTGAILTTANVSRDILTQDIQPTLSTEDFISSALKEAVNEIGDSLEMLSTGNAEDIAQTVGELLENEELRQEIGKIFDVAGTKLRLEVETMKKEQLTAIQSGSDKSLEYLLSEKQRISEADESVSRMIRAVASRTDDVQKAMEELELAKNQASGGKGGSGSIEETALTLKKGGIIKQASLVGGLLFGSRAFTETILVLNSQYGEEHFIPALAQLFIALACATYFLAGKIE